MIAIDTGPLVALCDPRDARHRAAVRDLERLETQTFGVPEAVLVEACFHLPWVSQRNRLRFLIDEIDAVPLPDVTSAALRDEAFDWLAKYADHEPDWADACLAVLSGRDRQLRIWTYDREFRTTWRRPDGTTIPLALRT